MHRGYVGGAGKAVHRQRIDPRRARCVQPRRRLDQRAAAGDEIIDQHHRPSRDLCGIFECHGHIAVAAPLLAADDKGQARKARNPADPLVRFRVRPGQHRRGLMIDRSRQQRCGGDRDGRNIGDDFAKATHPVEMRIVGQHPVERARQQASDHPLAHRLAGAERHVLPHIGQIGRDQNHLTRAAIAQCRRSEQHFDQLGIGIIKRAVEQGDRPGPGDLH